MSGSRTLQLFQAYGVELEYMIVDGDQLRVLPISDQLLRDDQGQISGELELGDISWSNELVLHVVELKTSGPAPRLEPLAARFQENVQQINERLAPLGGRLMPTAMHPWMDPHREMKLWPHEYSAVYETYNRIFDCRGHGWANLQSVHLNLPFDGDEQFYRLHTAIRLLLPILPALAASSPIVEQQTTGLLDNRMSVYRSNSRRVPQVTGHVVPEPVRSRADYEQRILQPMYDAIAPLDTQRILQHEWLNSRGAIARFDRGAIEIRVLDIQECPQADLAIIQAIVAVLQALVEQRWTPVDEQATLETEQLAQLLYSTIDTAEQTPIHQAAYLRQLGWRRDESCTAGRLWRHVVAELKLDSHAPLQVILEHGPLARRLLRAVGDPPPGRLLPPPVDVYRRLCDCLQQGQMFV